VSGSESTSVKINSEGVKSYGISSRLESPLGKPLVTFAVFAYNQEKYIREAVEGAFSQTYEPLEIILSDDASSDRTFAIMKEMARSYRGPHAVRVRQSKVNEGLIDHVCSVAEIMQGEILILAAGDDISEPRRTASIVKNWNGKCAAMFSACDLIDEAGTLLQTQWMPKDDATERFPWVRNISTHCFVYGSSSAYSNAVLRALPRAGTPVLSEDTPLNLIIQLSSSQIFRNTDSLVRYRLHSQTISIKSSAEASFNSVLQHEKRLIKNIKITRDILLYIRKILIPSLAAEHQIDLDRLDADIWLCEVRLDWYVSPLFKRIFKLASIPKSKLRWFLGRIFGASVYSAIKATSLRVSQLQRQIKGLKT